jgi:epoxide hydrolase-like predicted phosphatase
MKRKKRVNKNKQTKKINHKIKTIFFDVGGVLALGKNSSWKHSRLIPSGVHLDVSEKLKMPLDQYLEAIETVFAQSIEGKIPEKQAVQILANKLKVSESKLRKIYIWAYRKNMKVNKQLHKKALELKKLGYEIAVLSDQWYLSKPALMPKKLYKKFSEKIVSCDVGMRKPNPDIYKVALKKMHCKPEEALFIDNQEWNLPPARKIGMEIIQFQDNQQLFENKIWKSLFK